MTTNALAEDCAKLPQYKLAVTQCNDALNAADLKLKDQQFEVDQQAALIKDLLNQRDQYAKEAIKPRPSRLEWFLYGAATMAATGFLLGRIK